MAPTLDSLSLSALALAFLAALTGSLHCVGMCGPLRLLAGEKRWAGAGYQLGRLLAYLVLGAIAGTMGAALPSWVLFAFIALAIVSHLTQVRLFPSLGKWRQALLLAASSSPMLIGFVSGLLPCGLLHGWIGAAAVTASPLLGAMMLALLWAGTLPALEIGTRVFRRPLQKLRQRFPKAMPIALLLLALAPLGLRTGVAAQGKPAAAACHGTATPASHEHASPHPLHH